MELGFVPADGVDDVESVHISEIDVGDAQAEVTVSSLLDSVTPRQSYRNAIAAILENYSECIGHTRFILDDEDSTFLLLAFTHKRPLAIRMPATSSSAFLCGR